MKSNNELVDLWIKKAGNDLKNVTNNLKLPSEEIPTDTVCFHCQQAVEKYLKAFLISRNAEFILTHNIANLIDEAAKFESSIKVLQEKAESLTPYAVEIRYPDDYYIPSVEETTEAYAIAIEVRDFVLKHIDEEPGSLFS